MSYRIFLNTPEETIEIWDETPIEEFKIAKGKEVKEYPDYIIDKKAMFKIIKFYQEKLHKAAKETVRDKDLQAKKTLFRYAMEKYFEKINEDNMVIGSDNFFLQYFYLVEIYKNTDWEKNKFLITH
jgi:hypothetical protein